MLSRRRFLVGAAAVALGADMLARRLLSAGAGGGGFTLGFEVTAAPLGGWVWFIDPRAISYNGYTYLGYIQGGSGDVTVQAVQESPRVAETPYVLHAALELDDHDNPGLYIRPSDHKLLCFYSKHLGSNVRLRVSTNSLDSDPTLSGGFAAETTFTFSEASGDRFFTYPNPIYLSAADGVSGDTLWLFERVHMGGTNAEWHYNVSSDGGATFAADGIRLHSITYQKVVSDEVGTIHVAVAHHSADPSPQKIYHLYRQSAAWHKSDGTTITASMPFGGSDLTTVYDSGGDYVWVWDLALDGTGKPVITFVRFVSTSDHRYYYARWTGAAWDVHEIAHGGGYFPTAGVGANPIEDHYSGGVVLDHSDPSIVYASVGLGSDLWELRRYVTTDGGATWAYIVVGRPGKNVRPVSVKNHGSIKALVLHGPYASYVDYDVGTDGVA